MPKEVMSLRKTKQKHKIPVIYAKQPEISEHIHPLVWGTDLLVKLHGAGLACNLMPEIWACTDNRILCQQIIKWENKGA